MMKYRSVFVLVLLFVSAGVLNAAAADFDDLTLAADSSWSGDYNSDGVGGTYDGTTFTSGPASFNNFSDGDWFSWGGFAYSNKTDQTTSGYLNQFSSFAGSAHTGSNFAVGFMDSYNGFTPTLTLASEMVIDGLSVTNTTYCGLALLNGEGPAKAFGGSTGDDKDWFKLTIEGFDSQNGSTGTVDFLLADYTADDNTLDYVVDSWKYVDLTSLGSVKSLQFTVSSTDNGQWGMNTPAYFAIDTVVPEPATMMLLGLGALLAARKR